MAVPDDESAVAATGEVTLSGKCTATGVLCLYVGGRRVRVQAVGGEELAATMERVVQAVNADGELPVTAAVKEASPGVLTLTCKWKGATGNDIDLAVNLSTDDSFPAGLTASCGKMASGAADPDMENIITAMGDTWWKALVLPWNQKDGRVLLEEWLDAQFGPLRQQECQAFLAYRGTLSETSTYGNAGNSQLVSCMGIGSIPTSPPMPCRPRPRWPMTRRGPCRPWSLWASWRRPGKNAGAWKSAISCFMTASPPIASPATIRCRSSAK